MERKARRARWRWATDAPATKPAIAPDPVCCVRVRRDGGPRLVGGIVAVVIVNYRQLIARYPGGGGTAGAVGEAFGDAWSFLPIGALIVDFVLTIAISVSAGASAVIAYVPELAPMRIALALVLVLVVGGITLFGHLGRVVFAVMTISFIVVAAIVLVYGLGADPQPPTDAAVTPPGGASIFAVLLAFPVAMALATGVEALPSADSTLVAELARIAAPAPVFAAFQLVTALLLLAAASSSFQAGPGLLAALAERSMGNGHDIGILPRALGRTNRARTPYWGVALFGALAMLIVAVGGGRDQVLVLFYAVAVFISFLAGLAAMARFSK